MTKIKEKYLFENHRIRFILVTQTSVRVISFQNYIAKFEDLTLHCDVREYCSHTVTRFIWDLRSKIRRAMITGSYDLDTVEETFDVALRIDLTFKRLVNTKARCCKCEGYEHYDYHCLSKS